MLFITPNMTIPVTTAHPHYHYDPEFRQYPRKCQYVHFTVFLYEGREKTLTTVSLLEMLVISLIIT